MALGSLIAIHDFGAGEIAELKPIKGATIMVPFGSDRLISFDMTAKNFASRYPMVCWMTQIWVIKLAGII